MAAAVAAGGNELRSSARLQKKSRKNRATATRLPNAFAEEIPNMRGDVMCVRCASGFSPSDELDEVGFRSADWGDAMESQLRELLLGCLDSVYRDAVKRIAACGYSDDLATEAVLTSLVSYRSKEGGGGGRNLLGDALSVLRDGGGGGGDGSDDRHSKQLPPFESLQEMEKHVLEEMISVLREARPFFSTGDAMWCLLVCDMDMHRAFGIHVDPCVDEIRWPATEGHEGCGFGDLPECRNFEQLAPSIEGVLQSMIGIPDLPPPTTNQLNPNGESLLTQVKKGQSSRAKRDSLLRQKYFHIEKTYQMYGTRGAVRSGRVSNLGGLISDRKCRPFSDPTGINVKSAMVKLGKTIRSRDGGGCRCSSNDDNAGGGCDSVKARNANDDVGGNCMMMPSHDHKDEVLLKLTQHVHELQMQLDEWKKWAEQKVMQAAQRLRKDRAEIQILRQAKDEVGKLNKEKETLEHNTLKKFTEMENAIAKAGNQVAWNNGAKCRLEIENAELRIEMESAKLRALKSVDCYHEASKRETEILKKIQSWDRQKPVLQEEVMVEKRELSELREKLNQAVKCQHQLEASLRREEKMKDEVLRHANSIARKREAVETSAKSQEALVMCRTNEHLQRHMLVVEKLKEQIDWVRRNAYPPHVITPSWGVDGGKIPSPGVVANMYNFSELSLQESECGYHVPPECECVMCLTEEKSVLFLPCAHQVVCVNCNKIHEKQGMKDCPSCRTPIQRRIPVHFPNRRPENMPKSETPFKKLNFL